MSKTTEVRVVVDLPGWLWKAVKRVAVSRGVALKLQVAETLETCVPLRELPGGADFKGVSPGALAKTAREARPKKGATRSAAGRSEVVLDQMTCRRCGHLEAKHGPACWMARCACPRFLIRG